MTELEKMRAGEPYRPGDPELVAMRKRAQRLLRDYNHTVYGDERTILFTQPFDFNQDSRPRVSSEIELRKYRLTYSMSRRGEPCYWMSRKS